jgi:TonB family protein
MPSDHYIYKSTGFAELDEACIKAVMKAPFMPAIKDGVATGAPVRIPLTWRLGKY